MTSRPPVLLRDDEYDEHDAAAPAGTALLGRVGAGLERLRGLTGFGLQVALRRAVPPALGSAPIARVLDPVGRRDRSLATVRMRRAGADVPLDAGAIRRAFPDATARILVLVPDVGESEACWDRHATQVGPGYGERLASLLDWTPVTVRLDRLAVAEAGVALTATLQRLVEEWPVPVERIAFVAHGAGGLVVRAAAGMRAQAPRPWPALVRDVVLLDTPLLVASTPRFASAVGRRLEEQLAGVTTDQPDVPALDHARYTAITTRGPGTDNPVGQVLVGQVLGALLWWRHRAGGRARGARPLFPVDAAYDVDPGDLSLLNHPEIHRALLGLLV